MNPRIGFVTIGQSPRPDIIGGMKSVIGDGLQIIEGGALDDMSKDEVFSFLPADHFDEECLVTKLRDGTNVVMPKNIIVKGIAGVLKNFESQGIKVAAILCVGEFPEYRFNGIVLKPGDLSLKLVSSLYQEGKGVIVIPLEEQRKGAMRRWSFSRIRPNIKVFAVDSNSKKLENLSEEIEQEAPDFVVLDCMGFDKQMKQKIRSKVQCPVILPKTLLGYMIKEIL
jgi:protein AroM